MGDPLDDIPNDWITKDEAIYHTMRVMRCSREEAVEILAELERDKPESVMTVWRQ